MYTAEYTVLFLKHTEAAPVAWFETLCMCYTTFPKGEKRGTTPGNMINISHSFSFWAEWIG